jgi:hypothetical protein
MTAAGTGLAVGGAADNAARSFSWLTRDGCKGMPGTIASYSATLAMA